MIAIELLNHAPLSLGAFGDSARVSREGSQ